MMDYEGGDLLLAGAARPVVGSLRRPVQAMGGDLKWPCGSVSVNKSTLEVTIHEMRYTIRRLTLPFYALIMVHARNESMLAGATLSTCYRHNSYTVDMPMTEAASQIRQKRYGNVFVDVL